MMPNARPSGLVARLGVAIAVVYFLGFGITSYLSPCGAWQNQVDDTEFQFERDPGAFYLQSAHQISLFLDRRPLFFGHPGIPLQISLYVVQRGLYATVGWRSPLSFSEFTARHLPLVYTLSKLLMALIQLLSFYCFYLFCRRFLRTEEGRAIALLAYVTSFPVLFYFSRISAEGCVVLFLLLAFLLVGRASDALARGRLTTGLLFSAGAALASIAGVFSKVHLTALLPVAVGFELWMRTREGAARRQAVPALGTFALVCVGALAIMALFFFQQGDFFSNWRTAVDRTTDDGVIARLLKIPLAQWYPAHSRSGLFAFLELPMVVLGIVGGVLYVRHYRRESRNLAPFGLVVLASLGAWLYRTSVVRDFSSIHYLFPMLLLASLFIGYLWERAIVPTQGYARAAAVLLGILVLHHASVWSVLDSRARDILRYRQYHRAVFAAIEAAGDRGRVGVVDETGGFEALSAGGFGVPNGTLYQEFEKLFVVVDAAGRKDPRLAETLRGQGVTVLLENGKLRPL